MKVIFKQDLKFAFDGIKVEEFKKNKPIELLDDKVETLNNFFKKDADSYFTAEKSSDVIIEEKKEEITTTQTTEQPVEQEGGEGKEKTSSDITLEFIKSLSDMELLAFAEEQQINVETAENEDQLREIIIKTLNITA